jgi:hypothetical protein
VATIIHLCRFLPSAAFGLRLFFVVGSMDGSLVRQSTLDKASFAGLAKVEAPQIPGVHVLSQCNTSDAVSSCDVCLGMFDFV